MKIGEVLSISLNKSGIIILFSKKIIIQFKSFPDSIFHKTWKLPDPSSLSLPRLCIVYFVQIYDKPQFNDTKLLEGPFSVYTVICRTNQRIIFLRFNVFFLVLRLRFSIILRLFEYQSSRKNTFLTLTGTHKVFSSCFLIQ